MLRGDFQGREAKRLGIVEFCVPRAEVHERAHALAEDIVQWPRPALIGIKAGTGRAGRDGYLLESEYTRGLAQQPETKALIAAFFAKS